MKNINVRTYSHEIPKHLKEYKDLTWLCTFARTFTLDTQSNFYIPLMPIHDISAFLPVQGHTTIHQGSLTQFDCLDLDVADEPKFYDAY